MLLAARRQQSLLQCKAIELRHAYVQNNATRYKRVMRQQKFLG
jgi:hypothetical protein